MPEKSVLITGCSSGIGYDAAHGLRARGWRVFASCRKAGDCARLQSEGFESPRIDYEDSESIVTGLAEVLEATDGRLDGLFHNGAYGIPAAAEDLPTEALRHLFEAGFFGWHELTRHAIPVMRGQGAGRIVMNSSILGFLGYRWRSGYTAAKHAVEGYADVLRIEMAGTGIHVSLIQPGPIATDMRKNSAIQFDKWIDWEASVRADEYRETLVKRLYGPGGRDAFELPPSAVTAKLIHALEHPRPRPRYAVTRLTQIAGFARRFMSTRMADRLLARV